MAKFLTGTDRGTGGLRVNDDVEDVYGVTHITVSNGTLSDNGGGHVTITTGGGGGGGMTSWTVAGASGSSTVSNGETVTVTGSGGITTAESGRTVTVSPNGILEDLNTLGAASSDGEFIVATGAGVFAYESGATARTSLGLGTIATQDANAVTITGGSISGITDLAISDGGTGAGTAQAAIDALTQVSGATVGHVLTKVGTNATWAAGGGGGGGISFNGSTANGLVTYGGATTADVEANLTFDGSTLAVTGNLTTTTSVSATTTVTAGTTVTGETVTSGSLTVNTRGTTFGPSLSAAGATDLTTLGFSAVGVPANTIYKGGAGTALTIDDAALVALPDGTRITITALEPGAVVFESPIYGGAISAYDLSAPGDGVTIQSCAALGPSWLIISSAGTAAPA